MWTTEQQQVIDARGCDLLVSAAAGAGKTAVLVERILSIVLDQAEGKPLTDIDHLLVVTFTKAAAAEMRERIRKGLSERLEDDPDNVHLQRQLTLLHHAQICTIDSFCSYLARNYYYAIDLDPGFRVADEKELQLLKEDVLGELLEEAFEQAEPDFLQFVEYFSTGKNDDNLEELIDQLYRFSQSHPYPEQWLQQSGAAYRMEHPADVFESPVGQFFESQLQVQLKEAAQLLQEAKEVMEAPGGPSYFSEAWKSEKKVIDAMQKSNDWQLRYDALEGARSVALRTPKNDEADVILRERAAGNIRAVREMRKQWKEKFFFLTPEEISAQAELCRPAVEELICLTLAFSARYRAAKQEKNLMDFSDLEHAALAILREKDGTPTEVARHFRDYFVEIMIDEYQDSNRLQEEILTAISKNKKGEHNLFLVGDVKQSIYKFRQACPELFIQKMTEYPAQSEARLICLSKNFRSRREVLDAANFVFRGLMQKEVGGIAYDAAAALHYGASYDQEESAKASNRYAAEILHCNRENLLEADEKEMRIASEAQMVAARICELTAPDGAFRVQDANGPRPAVYSDIVILLRSRTQWAEVFVNTLMDAGIPAYAEATTGFYETREVQTILQYLALLDNARQDIPLASVLASPIGALNSGELAQIRAAYPEVPFYEAARTYAKLGCIEPLRERLAAFFAQLDELRELVAYTQMHALLWQVYDRTGFYEYASAMPAGELRRANLDMLVQQAIAYETTSYRGLFHFLRYVEKLQKYDMDIGEASTMRESMNAVRIMTIHKSKGLEFPVVFVSGLGKQFNDQDQRQLIACSASGGIGVDAVNLKTRTKSTGLIKQIVKEQLKMESRAEEIRILYVAMTRAREKLILTVAHEEDEAPAPVSRKQLRLDEIQAARSMWQWLRCLVGTDQQVFQMREWGAKDVKRLHMETENLPLAMHGKEMQEGEEPVIDPELEIRLQEMLGRLAYRYPYEIPAYSAKLSVSELKKRAMKETEEDGQQEQLYREETPRPLIPRFMEETVQAAAVRRGTAYHKLLECLDFVKDTTTGAIKERLEMLVQQGQMEQADAASIDCAQIERFLQSKIGVRMRRAAELGKLYREQPFVIGISAAEIYEEAPKEELIMIQGIIDAYFEEEERFVIVDYKTDRVFGKDGDKQLLRLYRAQLDYYARALTQLTGREVGEAYLYSFALEKEIVR